MGNRPSIFVKTPQEYLEDQWDSPPWLPLECPSGHVRVFFYVEWSEGLDDSDILVNLSTIKTDIPLEVSGELDLRLVRKMWGLERCMPIHSERLTAVEPEDPDCLSPLAITVLSGEEGILKLFEPSPSESMVRVRERRLRILRKYDASMTGAKRALFGTVHRILRPFKILREQYVLEVEVYRNHTSTQTTSQAESYTTWDHVRHILFVAALIYLVLSGAVARNLNFVYRKAILLYPEIFQSKLSVLSSMHNSTSSFLSI
ncbi:hypothetical protein BJ138DRAFT_1006884 [Hygrophoropsis aurantiaca]|uniref:Uncharacterized protein n=1 Tax=Hygrophoropsis aurantiaca TaxID=72124 RepID=A0ACB8AD57_9AGAM|nr:hypothetical protein BJ138DRAFT_1006884 [Hygrophoropsis aurantiaca]